LKKKTKKRQFLGRKQKRKKNGKTKHMGNAKAKFSTSSILKK
jgi:hypothetical protein